MDAASDHRAHAQVVRRWRKWFGWATIVFFCLFSGILVALVFSVDKAPQTVPRPARSGKGEPRGGLSSSLIFGLNPAAALTADANIREGTSTDTPLVGTISWGAQLTVTGRMEDYGNYWYYDWYRVRLQDGTTGYILGKLIPSGVAWLLAPAHSIPPDDPIITANAPAIITDPPATDSGKRLPYPVSPTPISPQPPPTLAPPEKGTLAGLQLASSPLIPLMISAGALAVSLLGFVSTTVMAWRGDRRAMRAEARAREEHGWKKAERETSSGFGL